MRIGKKKYTRQGKQEEQQPLDFAWIKIAALQMGLMYKEWGFLYYGEFRDMLEEFKKLHNMRTNGSTFIIAEEQKIADIDDL